MTEQNDFDVAGTWYANRLGRFTASVLSKLVTKTGKGKEGLSEGAMTYIYEKAAEIMTGRVKEISTWATEWGNEHEPEAMKRYIDDTGHMVAYGSQTFVEYGDNAGGSPDFEDETIGAVGDIKCPANTENHIKYLMLKTGEDLKNNCWDYWVQLQANALFTGKKICLFVSYDPRMLEKKNQLKVLRFDADPVFHKRLVERINLASEELKKIVNELTKLA